MNLSSYPKIYNIGHPSIKDLFSVEVIVEEKVDGSQFSFGVVDGKLMMRSRGAELYAGSNNKMFDLGIGTALGLFESGKLKEGWIYRGEYLMKPKHNALAYDRAPNGNVILFDVNTANEVYLERAAKEDEAARLGLEMVPIFYTGMVYSAEHFERLLETTSCLGGQKIEGVVCKQKTPTLFGPDKKALMGKYVSAAFREVHKGEWKESNPTRGDIIQVIIGRYRTPARYDKAWMHLREAGKISGEMKDIGPLIAEAKRDFLEECGKEVAQALYAHFANEITRSVVSGIPEWYKKKLLGDQFTATDTPEV